jgi:hypothetical protein
LAVNSLAAIANRIRDTEYFTGIERDAAKAVVRSAMGSI